MLWGRWRIALWAEGAALQEPSGGCPRLWRREVQENRCVQRATGTQKSFPNFGFYSERRPLQLSEQRAVTYLMCSLLWLPSRQQSEVE